MAQIVNMCNLVNKMPESKGYVRRNLISDTSGSIYFGGYIPNSKGLMRSNMRILGKYALVYLISGQGYYEDVNDYKTAVQAGDVIFVTPTLGHRYGPLINQNWEEIYFVFDGKLFDQLYLNGLFSELKPLGRLQPIHNWETKLKALLEKYFISDATQTFALLSEIQWVMAQSQSFTLEKKSQSWADYAKEYILNNQFKVIDFEKLSEDLELGYENFRKLFKEEFGMPPVQYQLSLLMEQACKLLVQENLSVKETAKAMQYADEFHFSKQFKKIIGISPKEYKKINGSH